MAGGSDTVAVLKAAVTQAGYEPRIKYEDYDWLDLRSPREEVEYLLRRHPKLDESDPELLSKALHIAETLRGKDGLVEDRVFTEVAWLSWCTKKEN